MDGIPADIWYLVLQRLSFGDCVRTRRVCHKWRATHTEEFWLRRTAADLGLSITPEFRELFRHPNYDLPCNYLYVLACAQRVNKYSVAILDNLDCLSFALLMRNAELVKYFTIRIEKFNSDDICAIDDLCSFLNEPVCLFECLRLIKDVEIIDPEEVFEYNVGIYSQFPKELEDQIFTELKRIKMVSDRNISACHIYRQFGFAGYTQVNNDDMVFFLGSGSPEDVENTGIRASDAYLHVASLMARKGLVEIETSRNSLFVSALRDRSKRKFIPHMDNLWSHRLGNLPEVVNRVFPSIYVSQIPRVLHACDDCYHYCYDPDHRCEQCHASQILP